MSLLSNLREKRAERFATATPATIATLSKERGRTVASVATVTVAKPTEGQPAPPSPVGAGDTPSITSWGWLIHYADREPVECYICPVVTYAELMQLRPDAIGAEPLPDLPELQEPIEVANIIARRSTPEDYLSTFLLA